jgi:transposase
MSAAKLPNARSAAAPEAISVAIAAMHSSACTRPAQSSGAWAAVRKKDSYLKAQFLRIKARRGPKKAIMAVAASILTAIYHMLKDGTLYQDLGSNHFQNRSKGQQTNRLIKRLAELGYDVALTPRTS